MFCYSPTLLCVFTFLIHTRAFFPTPPAPPIPPPHPHLSCTTSVSSEGPQAASLPSFHSLSPPLLCEFSANPRRLAGSIYVSLALPPVSCPLVRRKRAHAAVKVAFVPSGLYGELLSSFFKSTHPLNSSYAQNSTLKMQTSWFWRISEPSQAPGTPGQAGAKLACLLPSWLRWF